jgi:hypothetical protein
MPSQRPRKERSDKGTHRNGTTSDDHGRFAFRLNTSKPEEMKLLEAIQAHIYGDPKDKKRNIKTFLLKCVNDGLHMTRSHEEIVSETLEQQIERLAQQIDKLLSLNLQRVSGGVKAQEDDSTSGVNMDYLKRIQQTLRGAKK